MTITLPMKNADGQPLSISYCNACLICKANGWCYQNRDYDALVLKMLEADEIIFNPETPDDLTIGRILHPEITWFPEKRKEFILSSYAKVTARITVCRKELLYDVSRLFTSAEIICEDN